ncbi:hypothetical protein [Jiella sonneratiae]|uniref:Uncharacterized protein n=1 Tax=Jiella sonneratiae TaxID=2816856 RepID=A0ABS3J9E4_9HYPH|nr:hypothetical protein [Jiella sonneratiae]MBO0906291.1 hypothetical protein [Jiella sonneratiae]
MADITALKSKGKGQPPARSEAPANTKNLPRDKAVKNRPLQVQVPEDVFLAFSAEAGQQFDFQHGAKSQLFLRMWEAYQNAK